MAHTMDEHMEIQASAVTRALNPFQTAEALRRLARLGGNTWTAIELHADGYVRLNTVGDLRQSPLAPAPDFLMYDAAHRGCEYTRGFYTTEEV